MYIYKYKAYSQPNQSLKWVKNRKQRGGIKAVSADTQCDETHGIDVEGALCMYVCMYVCTYQTYVFM